MSFLKQKARNYFYKSDLPFRLLLSLNRIKVGQSPLAPINLPIKLKRRGIIYELNVDDPIQRKIALNLYEKGDLKQIASLIKKGGTCIDVGANVGFYTLHFAKKMQNTGKAYAFEADPSVFAKLKANCKLNTFGSIDIYNKAISNQNGKTTFHCSQDACSGSGSLEKFHDIAGQQIEIETQSLDSFLAEEKISFVDLIKIDIEGHEIKLLQGAKESLKKRKFGHIFVEFNGPRLSQKGHTFNEFCDYFFSNDYKMKNSSFLEQITSKKIDSSKICTNFLFSLH